MISNKTAKQKKNRERAIGLKDLEDDFYKGFCFFSDILGRAHLAKANGKTVGSFEMVQTP